MKCESCGKHILGEYEVMGGRNYCMVCYPEVRETENQRQALVAYIIKRFRIPQPTGFMFGQMKRLKNKYTYKNMRLTLQYAFDIVGLKPDPKYGISIVEYYHDDMLDYYRRMLQKSEMNKKITYDRERVVKVKSEKKDYKQGKLLDMDKFNKEE